MYVVCCNEKKKFKRTKKKEKKKIEFGCNSERKKTEYQLLAELNSSKRITWALAVAASAENAYTSESRTLYGSLLLVFHNI